ncbi:MAG: type II toxin-antitoxin system RelB/DinJ family antitoxin [Pyramidobacter sp.]|nr:type II toxin-antitoxin system RelB/DinJ family antitoxin [Pyramidobacter sp.]MBQ8129412.1 type II toxin-antitoxin system RelB/DinJ family antitoxin [Clostridia bacterium]
MSNVSNISFRTDSVLKEEFARIVEEMGLTVTTAFNAFMRATVQQQAMPFRLRARSRLTADEQEALALLRDPDAETFHSAHELAETDGWYE